MKDSHRKPTVYVTDDFGIFDQGVQAAGIRQGCPLSPFLFVLVMTCIDSDIEGAVSRHVVNNRIPDLNYDMVYYADDKILYFQSNRGLKELLNLTERISKQYGLNLNRDKCVAIPIKKDGTIHFQDGTQLAKGFEATYLGHDINRDVNIQHEVLRKIQEVHCTWFKLSAYWKVTRASKRWKVIVFDAIIRSKLLYGLETIHLIQSLSKKLDTFQFRCIRKFLGMSPTFRNRASTNKELLETATAIAFPEYGDSRKNHILSRLPHDS